MGRGLPPVHTVAARANAGQGESRKWVTGTAFVVPEVYIKQSDVHAGNEASSFPTNNTDGGRLSFFLPSDDSINITGRWPVCIFTHTNFDDGQATKGCIVSITHFSPGSTLLVTLAR